MNILLPKVYVPKIQTYPIIYLAGPIRSAPEWHEEAINFFLKQKQDITIISPIRTVEEDLEKYVLGGETNYFSRQREWENYYMDLTAEKGCVMFWLPGEEKHNCNKPYASMTRKELGDITKEYKYRGKRYIFVWEVMENSLS